MRAVEREHVEPERRMRETERRRASEKRGKHNATLHELINLVSAFSARVTIIYLPYLLTSITTGPAL